VPLRLARPFLPPASAFAHMMIEMLAIASFTPAPDAPTAAAAGARSDELSRQAMLPGGGRVLPHLQQPNAHLESSSTMIGSQCLRDHASCTKPQDPKGADRGISLSPACARALALSHFLASPCSPGARHAAGGSALGSSIRSSSSTISSRWRERERERASQRESACACERA
jgi:hypothetical protein